MVSHRLSQLYSQLSCALAELAWPTRCVVCDAPGELLCEPCRTALPWIAQRWACPVCGAPFGYLTCTECHKDWELDACVCALPLAGAGARLVLSLKDHHELRLAPIIAAIMACALDEASSWDNRGGSPRIDLSNTDAICFVPATAAAYARRGFDHTELIAAALARFIEVPLLDCLARHQVQDQRNLGREERRHNMEGSIEVVREVAGLKLLLIDDVITTGASLRACANALRQRGVADLRAAALCRTW